MNPSALQDLHAKLLVIDTRLTATQKDVENLMVNLGDQIQEVRKLANKVWRKLQDG